MESPAPARSCGAPSARPEQQRIRCGRNAFAWSSTRVAVFLRADVSTARFRGRIRNQTFGGAMDMLEIDCGNARVIRARIANPGPLSGEHEFEFAANDAVRVRETGDD